MPIVLPNPTTLDILISVICLFVSLPFWFPEWAGNGNEEFHRELEERRRNGRD